MEYGIGPGNLSRWFRAKWTQSIPPTGLRPLLQTYTARQEINKLLKHYTRVPIYIYWNTCLIFFPCVCDACVRGVIQNRACVGGSLCLCASAARGRLCHCACSWLARALSLHAAALTTALPIPSYICITKGFPHRRPWPAGRQSNSADGSGR